MVKIGFIKLCTIGLFGYLCSNIAFAQNAPKISKNTAVQHYAMSPEQTAQKTAEQAVTRSQQAPIRRVNIAQIDSRLNRLMDERGMVGLGVAIIENGELVHVKGYGQTVAGGTQPVTADTLFRWASLSKGVAATMVAKLDEAGQLRLDAPIARYASSLRLPERGEREAKVEHVLSHQLGIVRNAYDNRLEAGAHPLDIRASLAELPVQCQVGTCHGYQNVAFDASAEMVERVTGLSYQKAVSDFIFAPLGMRSVISSARDLVNAPNWARPHNSAGNNVYRRIEESYFSVPAAGGIVSSARDLGIWMRAQMGAAPQIISQNVLSNTQEARVTTPREQDRARRYFPYIDTAEYGLGWRVYDYAGRKVIGHRGAVDGYRAMIMFDPELKTGVAAMWNSGTNQPVGLQMEVMDMAFGLPSQDWLYLEDGPDFNAVKRLASKLKLAQPRQIAALGDVPVPSLSPLKEEQREQQIVRRVFREEVPLPPVNSNEQYVNFIYGPLQRR